MKKNSKKTLIRIVSVFTLLTVLAGGYWYLQVRPEQNKARTTSKLASAQDDYRGDSRHSSDGQGSDNAQGGAVDNRGDNNTDTSTGVTSDSGLITLLGPVKDQVFTSGSVLRGRAQDVDRIQYRVVDDNVGVIAQGSLDVVSGAFSGTMQFRSNGSSGRVDIFTYNQNYNEENNVQVQVRFKD